MSKLSLICTGFQFLDTQITPIFAMIPLWFMINEATIKTVV